MNVQSVHHSLHHTLSEWDATAVVNCTCMMAWSGIAHSVNNPEYCIYCIGNVSLAEADRTPISMHQLISGIYLFLLRFYLKLYEITLLCYSYCLITLQGSERTDVR